MAHGDLTTRADASADARRPDRALPLPAHVAARQVEVLHHRNSTFGPSGCRRTQRRAKVLAIAVARPLTHAAEPRPQRSRLGSPVARCGAVLAIAAVAIGLRFWRLDWGLLDERMAFPDELLIWAKYLRAFVPLGATSFERPDTVAALFYPTLFGYLAGLATALAHALGLVPSPHESLFESLLLARMLSATAGLATVALVGALAWRAHSPRAGLLAAALAAVVPLEVIHSHLVSVDILLGTGMMATLLLACRLARVGTMGAALATGLATGLTFGTKYTGLALTVPVAWAVVEAAWRERSPRRLVVLAAASLCAFALGFTLACPICVTSPARLLRSMSMLTTAGSWQNLAFWQTTLVPGLGWRGRPYVYQILVALPYALGWPLWLAAVAGVGSALRRHDAVDRILLVALVAYLLPIGLSAIDALRYLLPLLPILVVLAARVLAGPAEPARLPTATATGLRIGLSLFVLVATTALTASQVARFSFDQQSAVAAWIDASVERPASGRLRVALPHGMSPYFGLNEPLAARGLDVLPVQPGEWWREAPEVFVLPEWFAVQLERGGIPNPVMRADAASLRAGKQPYRLAWTVRSTYLQRDFYAWLDPVFTGQLEMGEIGFEVWVREDLATTPGPAAR